MIRPPDPGPPVSEESALETRWRPIRSGLLNVFKFDSEEFLYEDGHLLLRGNNGTGKSRVLALQLPFLLDGDVSPHRMEPDGDQAKRASWNLLMGKHQDRLGYTWIEFGRVDEDGEAHYLTLGCGLSAVAGRSKLDKWFFTTSKRIGVDLELETEDRQPLTRQRLTLALEGHGEVYTSAKSYRSAVDAALFGLGEHRYAALVDLLIQLRHPQLSRDLDARKLSSALSEALTPVSSTILNDVSEAFRSLESDRLELEGYETSSAAVASFLIRYGRYARVAARRRSTAVREMHSAYEDTNRRLRRALEEKTGLVESLEKLAARIELLETSEEGARSEVRTLEESPEMRDARNLDQVRREALERSEAAANQEGALTAAQVSLEERASEHSMDLERSTRDREELEAASAQASERAGELDLGREHREALASSVVQDESGEALDSATLERARAVLGRHSDRRAEATRIVGDLNAALDRELTELTAAKRRGDELSRQLDSALDVQRTAAENFERVLAELRTSYESWSESLEELDLLAAADDDDGSIAERLREWCELEEGPSPIEQDAVLAVECASRGLAQEEARLAEASAESDAELEQLEAEQALLESGYHAPPPLTYTRDVAAREDLSGAPFWSLCEFSENLTSAERAGLEAALESAGILDAWVTPTGELLEQTGEVLLSVNGDAASAAEHSLAEVLTPVVDIAASVPEGTVRAVLGRIGLGPEGGLHRVSTDGRWQLGPVHGSWQKPAAEYIGHQAREQRRTARLVEVRQAIEALSARQAELRASLAGIESRRRRIGEERRSAPDASGLLHARARQRAQEDNVRAARKRVVDSEQLVSEKRAQVEASRRERDTTAQDLGISRWVDDLRRLETCIGEYRAALAALWPAIRAADEARRQLRRSEHRLAQATEVVTQCSEDLGEARRRAEAARARQEALEGSVGVTVAQLLARLEEAREREKRLTLECRAALEERRELEVRSGVLDNERAHLEEKLERDTRDRGQAIERLSGFVRSGLLELIDDDAVSEDPEQSAPEVAAEPNSLSATRAVELARRLEVMLADVDDSDAAWARIEKAIHTHIQELVTSLLPQGHEPSTETQNGLLVIKVPFRGRVQHLRSLQEALSSEITTRKQLLDAREREVIENHLIGEVATHLHERIRAAAELVAEMNREISERPMSTGMTLRFSWKPDQDGPSGLADARERLLASGGTWTPAERKALGLFLQRQIQAARSEAEAGTWQEHLSTALDYRAWHEFAVERKQDGVWRKLTRRTHGTGSGGEKAIALTIPQFAAAAAHYRSASPLSPRLILLDEAFVGVDADMRNKCMGLLSAFDLDFVMTSEREWGCYPSLPGVAIYQMSTRQGIDAVGLTRWVWNGRERYRDDGSPPGSSSNGDSPS